MKRFHWPLQRLLDVTVQRERAQRSELLALSRRIARLRQEVLVHRVGIRALLAQAAAMDCRQRIREHADHMRCTDAHERRIAELERQATVLAGQRTAKSRQFLQTRKARETLDRLREEARREHVRGQLKIEQRQLDESAHVAKARKMIAARAAVAETA